MMRASIDIGSNSVLLLVADIDDKGNLKEVANESRVTGLGKGLSKDGLFKDESMKETYLAIKEYVALAQEVGVDSAEIIITATEASRVAKNAEEFFNRIIKKLNISVHVISGEGEAYYTALGVCKMAKTEGEFSIVDIGGASSEIMKVRVKPFKIINSVSLPMGSVRATDWISEDKLLNELRSAWAGTGAKEHITEEAIFVAGTMTSIAAMVLGMTKYEGDKVANSKIEFAKLKKFVASFSKCSAEDLLEQYPFLGKRSSSIIGGAEVALFIGEKLGLKSLQISPFGLRYGTIIAGSIEEQYVSRHFR